MTRLPLFPHRWAAVLAPLTFASGCVTSSEDLDALEDEAAIQDADEDGVAASQDCDDDDPSVGSQANDGDCDGIVSGLDCDDSDPALGSEASDGDCDGVVASWDCDDQDPAQASRENDADCDGVATEEDCDDADPRFFAPPEAGDCDADGYLDDTEDCDPRDAESTHIGNDADCDGAVTEEDCNDADPELVSVAYDRDCDGYVTSEDCDDDNAAVNPAGTEVPWDGLDNDCDGERSHPATEVVVGGAHACAVTTDAEIKCWGSDSSGQASPPPEALPIGLAAGAAVTCSLDEEGLPTCWGNDYPIYLVPDHYYTSVFGGISEIIFTAGGTEPCIIGRSAGSGCLNGVGGILDYSGSGVDFPQTVAMAAGQPYAIDSSGELTSWGATDPPLPCEGAYANFWVDPEGNPDNPGGWSYFSDVTVESLTAGQLHIAAVGSDGSLAYWGCNGTSPLGIPSSAAAVHWEQVSSGTNHLCALADDGSISCWGDNTFGQHEVPEGTYTFVAAGGNSSCAIRTDSELVCWGNDSVGQSSPP